MNSALKTKLFFLVSLMTKHAKGGIRSVCNRLAMEHFDKLICGAEDDVLYVGCGAGEEAVILGTRVRRVVGIDVDSSILKIAKKDYPADNVEYILDGLQDASPNLPEWRQSFSTVVSIDRIKNYPNVPSVIRNMVACLKPGGQLLCVIPNDDFNFFDGGAQILINHPEWGQKIKDKNYTLWHKTEEEAEAIFSELCDWSELSCKQQTISLSLTEKKAKQIWLDSLDALDHVGASHQRECLEAMWQWALAEYGSTEDGCLKKQSQFMVVYGVQKI